MTVKELSSTNQTVDSTITGIFREIGIPANQLGYYYALEAVKMATLDFPIIGNMMKSIYPSTAEKFNTTVSRVGRAIRYAVETAWSRGDPETLERYFGCTVSPDKGKPTNGEFIATIADIVRRCDVA